MQLLQRMNKKMDQGYKLTSYYCTFCSGVTLMKQKDQNVYCPKCDKDYKPVFDEKDDEQYYDSILDSAQPQTTSQQKNPQPIVKSIQSTPPPSLEPQQDEIEKSYNQFLSLYNSTAKTPAQEKSEKVSKKMGELLINGWAMLEDACQTCNVPLMKSKKGNMICCGCEKDYAKKQEPKTEKNKEQNKEEVKKENVKQKMQEKTIIKPQNLVAINNTSSVNNQQNRPSLVSQKIENISVRTLQFLQNRLEYAFSNNDLQAVQRILRITKGIKQLQ